MMFSLACMGMMAIPTESKANPYLAVAGGVYSFIKFIRHANKLYKIYKGWKKYNYLGKLRIPEINIPKSYSAEKIVEVLNHSFGLGFSVYGIKKALEYFYKRLEYWDREGYVQINKREALMNRAVVHLENKTNRKIERKVRLMLVNENNQEDYGKQFTLVANAKDSGTFNVSEYFRRIKHTGLKEFKYDVLGNYKDIEVSSTNKNIVVSNLLA